MHTPSMRTPVLLVSGTLSVGIALLSSLVLVSTTRGQNATFESSAGPLDVQTVASGLVNPWALAFLPDGRMLVTERPGRLLVDGKVHIEGKSVDPIAALQMLEPVLTARGRYIAAGQIVITGSLIGMNWLSGRHDLEGIVDGFGEVAIKLVAA